MLEKQKGKKRVSVGRSWLFSYSLFLLVLLLIGCLLINVVEGVVVGDDLCHNYDLDYCNCDVDCSRNNTICVSALTDNNVKLMCSASADRINMARHQGFEGYCAKVWSRVVVDSQVFDKYVVSGTSYCPKKESVVVVNDSSGGGEFVTSSHLPSPSNFSNTSSFVSTGTDQNKKRPQLLLKTTMSIVVVLCLILVWLAVKLFKLKKKLEGLKRIIELRYDGRKDLK